MSFGGRQRIGDDVNRYTDPIVILLRLAVSSSFDLPGGQSPSKPFEYIGELECMDTSFSAMSRLPATYERRAKCEAQEVRDTRSGLTQGRHAPTVV